MHTHTHTRTIITIYVYIYTRVCYDGIYRPRQKRIRIYRVYGEVYMCIRAHIVTSHHASIRPAGLIDFGRTDGVAVAAAVATMAEAAVLRDIRGIEERRWVARGGGSQVRCWGVTPEKKLFFPRSLSTTPALPQSSSSSSSYGGGRDNSHYCCCRVARRRRPYPRR